MSLPTDLKAALGHAGVTALVGTRVYPDVVAQGAQMPAVAYQLITGNRDQCLSGSGDTVNERWQIDCYADTRLGALALYEAVCTGIEASIAFEAVRGLYQDFYEEDTRRYRRMVEYSIWQTA